MLSKFAKKIKLSNSVYSIFNSLIMLPIFTDNERAEKIFSNDLDSFSKSELDELKKAGIITDNNKFDTLLLEAVCETQKELLENKITIMYLIPTNTCN